jgi:hypothetical protein
VLARRFALLVAAALLAAVLGLLIGFETLRSPAYIRWMVMAAGAPAPALVAAALPALVARHRRVLRARPGHRRRARVLASWRCAGGSD